MTRMTSKGGQNGLFGWRGGAVSHVQRGYVINSQLDERIWLEKVINNYEPHKSSKPCYDTKRTFWMSEDRRTRTTRSCALIYPSSFRHFDEGDVKMGPGCCAAVLNLIFFCGEPSVDLSSPACPSLLSAAAVHASLLLLIISDRFWHLSPQMALCKDLLCCSQQRSRREQKETTPLETDIVL